MSKKNVILKSAAHLFASQGFDGTTTLQIAGEAGVTEPLIYYHFKGKDELFTSIVSSTFKDYQSRLDALHWSTTGQFENIRQLINLHFDFIVHFDFIEQWPDESYLIVSTCPSRLKDPEDICPGILRKQRDRLMNLLSNALEEGVRQDEFNDLPIQTTASLLVAMINGLVRQRVLSLENMQNMRATTVEFCRRSLMK